MYLLGASLSFVLGLIFGSFLNVIIYRLPKDMSIVYPPSHCPFCGHKLAWYDNIPLISYVILKGKCRYCGHKIPIRYPLVEFLTGLLFLIAYLTFGLTIFSLRFLIAGVLSIAISWIDAEHGVVPDSLTLFGVIAGLIIGVVSNIYVLKSSILGINVGLIAGLVIRGVGFLIAKREAFGEGDITYMTMLGSLMGPTVVLAALFLGSFLGLFWAAIQLLLKKQLVRQMKFCPFMSLGFILFVLITFLAKFQIF